nr:thiol:disulfide interchange protein [Calliblepharis sp.]
MDNNFINFLEMKSYYLQQKTYIILYSRLNYFYLSTCMLSLLGGILTCFNPCLISLLPISLSSIKDKHNINYTNAIIYGLISSTIIIISMNFLFNKSYNTLVIYIPIFSSILTILIGLHLLQLFKINFSFLNFSNEIQEKSHDFMTYWILGFTIGISSSTCSTPILTTIIIWLNHSENLLLGTLYTVFYLIGYTLPLFLLINIITNYSEIHIINNIWNYIIPTSGSILIATGFFSFLENILIL